MAPLPIPDELDQLTPAWLGEALRDSGVLRGATIASASAELMAVEKGIGGRVARVSLAYAESAPEAPSTIVAKLPSAIELTRAGGHFLRLPEREVRFYTTLASRVPLRTPGCYHAAVAPDGDAFVLLLEDLGALPSGDDVAGTTRERAERVVDALAEMHTAWWQSAELDGLEWMPGIDERGMIWQRMFATAWRDYRYEVDELVPEALLPLTELLTRRLGAALWQLAASPTTLLHGDLRLDNLFFEPGDHPGVAAVDWSNATRGPGGYDLAYFMCTAFDPDQRRMLERPLLERYCDALAERGVEGYGFDACFDDYRLSFCEPFARMFFLLVRGHGEKDHARPEVVLSKFVRNAGQAAVDLDASELIPA